MFHRTENSTSTGEPPTPPNPTSSTTNSAAPSNSGGLGAGATAQRPPIAPNMGSTRSLSTQEQDSGYEASPSSIADNTSCALHFFGEPTLGATGQSEEMHTVETADDDSDVQDCPSIYLFVESDSEADIDDWDMCRDCNSAACCGCYRTDSSTTNATTSGATAIPGDLSNCDSNSSESSNRPSSLPIQIPIIHPRSQRRLPWTDSSPSPRLDMRLRPSRSNPLEFRSCSPVSFSLMTGSHPLSWPSTDGPWRSAHHGTVALPVFLNTLRSSCWEGQFRSRRTVRRPVRSRRMLIDSDASSFSSSDEDGPEDVFNMATDEASPSFEICSCPLADVTDSGPLPDVVLHSSPVNQRRGRSVSVNLPPQEEVWHTIGTTLRRLSDQFQMDREFSQRLRQRRRTIGNINHLHRS